MGRCGHKGAFKVSCQLIMRLSALFCVAKLNSSHGYRIRAGCTEYSLSFLCRGGDRVLAACKVSRVEEHHSICMRLREAEAIRQSRLNRPSDIHHRSVLLRIELVNMEFVQPPHSYRFRGAWLWPIFGASFEVGNSSIGQQAEVSD